MKKEFNHITATPEEKLEFLFENYGEFDKLKNIESRVYFQNVLSRGLANDLDVKEYLSRLLRKTGIVKFYPKEKEDGGVEIFIDLDHLFSAESYPKFHEFLLDFLFGQQLLMEANEEKGMGHEKLEKLATVIGLLSKEQSACFDDIMFSLNSVNLYIDKMLEFEKSQIIGSGFSYNNLKKLLEVNKIFSDERGEFISFLIFNWNTGYNSNIKTPWGDFHDFLTDEDSDPKWVCETIESLLILRFFVATLFSVFETIFNDNEEDDDLEIGSIINELVELIKSIDKE